MSLTHDAFLSAIVESPDDDTPRLVYADWLEEQGDPLGPFIRVQCQLAPMADDDPRRLLLEADEARLEAEVRRGLDTWPLPAWAARVPAWALKDRWRFKRGLIGWLSTTAVRYARGAAALHRAAPVRHLRVRNMERYAAEVFACDGLRHIRSLDLSDNPLGTAAVVGLRESPHVRGLRELDLGYCRLQMRDVQRLAGAASLASVERLRLAGNRLFDTGTEALLASPHLKRVRELDLRNTQLGPRGATALGEASSLERLRVGVNRLGDEGARRLSGGGGLRALTHLGLGSCQVTTSGAAELLASSGLPALSHLDLSENPIDGGLFLTSPSAARRGRLHLTLETHHLPGEEAMIDSPLIAACAGLDLKVFELAEETMLRLARSACPGGLRALTLFVGAAPVRAIEALGGAPHLGALRELALIGYLWDEERSRALLAMPLLRRLRSLSLLMGQVREAPRELAARAGDLAHLERLTLSPTFMSREGTVGQLREALGWRLRVA